MTKADEYQPRLSILLTQDQFDRLRKVVPHGLKGQIFRVLIEDLLNILEDTGQRRELVLAAIINRMVNIPNKSLEIVNEPSRDSS